MNSACNEWSREGQLLATSLLKFTELKPRFVCQGMMIIRLNLAPQRYMLHVTGPFIAKANSSWYSWHSKDPSTVNFNIKWVRKTFLVFDCDKLSMKVGIERVRSVIQVLWLACRMIDMELPPGPTIDRVFQGYNI